MFFVARRCTCAATAARSSAAIAFPSMIRARHDVFLSWMRRNS